MYPRANQVDNLPHNLRLNQLEFQLVSLHDSHLGNLVANLLDFLLHSLQDNHQPSLVASRVCSQ